MHLFKKSLTKAAILSAPFALAFTLSACEDSGTDSDGTNTPGTSEGTENNKTTENGEGTENSEGAENGEGVKENPCDFDINDPEWTFSYLDVTGPITWTFKYEENTRIIHVVYTYDDNRPCDRDTSATVVNEIATTVWSDHCEDGKLVSDESTTYAIEGYFTREAALDDAKLNCETFTVEGPKNRAEFEELLKENEESTAE